MLSVTLLLGNFLTLRVTKFKQLGNVVVTIKPWKLILSVGEHCQSHRKRLFVWGNRALTTALQKFKSSLPIQLSKRQKKYKWFNFFLVRIFCLLPEDTDVHTQFFCCVMLHYIIQWKRLKHSCIKKYKPERSEAIEQQIEILWKQLNNTSEPWLWRWFWSSELSMDWLMFVHQCPRNAYCALALHVCVIAHSL